MFDDLDPFDFSDQPFPEGSNRPVKKLIRHVIRSVAVGTIIVFVMKNLGEAAFVTELIEFTDNPSGGFELTTKGFVALVILILAGLYAYDD